MDFLCFENEYGSALGYQFGPVQHVRAKRGDTCQLSICWCYCYL